MADADRPREEEQDNQAEIERLSEESNNLQDEQVHRILEDSQHRINSMALIHEELYNSGDLARVDFGDYSRILMENLFDSYGISTSHIGPRQPDDSRPHRHFLYSSWPL